MALSQPGLLFVSSPTGTDDVKDLGGRTFFSLASGEAEVLALCHDGVHSVTLDGTLALTDVPMVTAASGRGFYVGIDSNQSVYTWGSLGQSGQVALSFFITIHCVTTLTKPELPRIAARPRCMPPVPPGAHQAGPRVALRVRLLRPSLRSRPGRQGRRALLGRGKHIISIFWSMFGL